MKLVVCVKNGNWVHVSFFYVWGDLCSAFYVFNVFCVFCFSLNGYGLLGSLLLDGGLNG